MSLSTSHFINAGSRFKNIVNSRLLTIISSKVHTNNLKNADDLSSNPSLIKLINEDANSGLRRIIMSDMKTRNALSFKMMSELVDAINFNKSNPALRAMTIEAEPGPVFSAGHNLKEMVFNYAIKNPYYKGVWYRSTASNIFKMYSANALNPRNSIIINTSEVPVIGVVNGLAAAAGCQLVSSCDFSIATSNSKFSTPGANFGLFCSTPGVGISRVVNRSTAAFMLMTGVPITAQEALNSGLIVALAQNSEELETKLQEIYGHIRSKSRPVLKLGKKFFYEQLNKPYEEAMRQGEDVMLKNLGHDDCHEGLSSFKEKRKPTWTHSQKE